MIISYKLKKTFFDFNAVNDLDIEVRPGECFGLLGPNGAGKSTFISMVYGASVRTSGELKVFGMDPNINARQIKKRLGVVTQDNALDENLSIDENMSLYCSFLGIPKVLQAKKIDDLLEYMNLSHKKHALIQTLSGGMKRRLVFVRALLGDPELLILDEPTTGLDPAVRHLLWGKVRELKSKGTTILLTTHYMHEAEVLCDRLVILNKGATVAEGSPQAMIQQHTPGAVGIFNFKNKPELEKFVQIQNDFILYEDSSGLYIRGKSMDQITQMCLDTKVTPLQIRPANLEDVFLKLTGQDISDEA